MSGSIPQRNEARGIVGGPVSYALGVDGTGLVTFKFDLDMTRE